MSYINFYTYRLKMSNSTLYAFETSSSSSYFLPPSAGKFKLAVTILLTPLTKQRTSGVVTAGVEGAYSTVERAVMCAHLTISLYNLHEAVHDDAAAPGHRHCSIYTFNWVAMGWAGNEDRGGVSTVTTTSLSPAIVAGRNMLRRRCYGPETSA